jgi:hypothetical protein
MAREQPVGVGLAPGEHGTAQPRSRHQQHYQDDTKYRELDRAGIEVVSETAPERVKVLLRQVNWRSQICRRLPDWRRGHRQRFLLAGEARCIELRLEFAKRCLQTGYS